MTKTYDQTTGELCEKCGWSMKFPDEPCRCELERENAALRADKERLDWLESLHFLWEGTEKTGPVFLTRDAIDAARNETRPSRADHNGDINEMMQKGKEAQP